MKATFLTCLIYLILAPCKAQTGKTITGDTTFWHNLQQQKTEKLRLKSLLNSTDAFNFRFWSDREVVDIWSLDNSVFNGMITCFTQGKKKTHYRQFYLDTAKARKVFQLTKNLEKIPTDKSITGWKQGLDGTEYIFEGATSYTYNFKTYWTPDAQDSILKEAIMIKRFIYDLESVLSLSKKYDTFFSGLKPGSYLNGMIIITKHTKKQSAAIIKIRPYLQYLNSKQDTLSNYLNDTLTEIFTKSGAFKCYNEFDLLFSKDNRLLKITTPDKDLSREDKKEFNLCRQKIFAAFNSININFIHSKIPYHQWLSFDGTKASVYSRYPSFE